MFVVLMIGRKMKMDNRKDKREESEKISSH